MKTIKILKIVFILTIILLIGTGFILVSNPKTVWAADPIPLDYTPQIKIPASDPELNQASIKVGSFNPETGVMTSDLLAKYVKAFYDYGMAIAGILAAIVLMGGGVLWLTSAGNDSKITQAKELIGGSIVGLVILFSSWVILNTINPDLINLKIITLQVAKPAEFETNGIINNLSEAPTDLNYGWYCSGSTCQDIDPSYISMNENICNNRLTIPAECTNRISSLICCGYSQSDIIKADTFCKDQDTGTGCKLGKFSTGPDGYCANNKCNPCINFGQTCQKNYECMSMNEPIRCGMDYFGSCECNILGNNCTCEVRN